MGCYKAMKEVHDKILVVDDNPVNRKLLRVMLEKEGYEVLEAEDGETAVIQAFKGYPDLILLDIMMPKKDGYQVCAELKGEKETNDIPIIFLSAMGAAEDKIRAFELGGADYVTKPFNRNEVLARVKAQLKIRHLTRELINTNRELLKKQEALEKDLKAAAEIQRHLLPRTAVDIPFMDSAWRFMPCQEIGGDIFNLFQLTEEYVGIYMLDVSGHGVPSAMVAVSVSNVLRPQTGYFLKRSTSSPPYYEIVSPAKVLRALDREYPIDRFDKFFTISYLLLNGGNGILKYSNAAHPPPVLLHGDGSLELLKEGGTIIGLGGVVPFEEGTRQLVPGDKVFVYTDGIVEYQDINGDFYGDERLYQEIKRQKEKPVSDMVDGIIDSIMDFGKGSKPHDDVSLLALEFKGG